MLLQDQKDTFKIRLEPLSQEQLGQFISQVIQRRMQDVQELVQVIHTKTIGNPFFAMQMIQQMYQQCTIYFDFEAKCWKFNMETVQQAGLAVNVAQLTSEQFDQLNARTRRLLHVASCIGKSFDAIMMEEMLPLEKSNILPSIYDAVNAGWLCSAANQYQFLHDKLQETAYNTLSAPEKQQIHLLIGQTLLRQYQTCNQFEMQIFGIVNHLNQNLDWFKERSCERLQLIQLNAMAAKRSIVLASTTLAKQYVNIARKLCTKSDGTLWKSSDTTAWPTDMYTTLYDLHVAEIEAERIDGTDLERAAELTMQLISKCQQLGTSY